MEKSYGRYGTGTGTGTVRYGTYRVGDADRIKSQWRALGEQMEDDMIPESYKCDGRKFVVRLEK